MLKYRTLTFGKLVEELSSVYNEDGEIADDEWAVYYKSAGKIKKSTVCCIADLIEITDDYEEIYPDFAIQNDMDAYVTNEIMIDVISEYLTKKSKATVKQLIDAVNYYLENDCFIYVEPDANAFKTPQVIIEKEIIDKRILMKIKKAFSLEIPLGEFLALSHELPYVITNTLTLVEVKKIIKNNGLKDYVTIKF